MKISTSVGEVPVAGYLSVDTNRPVLFAIRGFLPPKDHLLWLGDELRKDADVMFVHLPGMHCPVLTRGDIGTMAAAFQQVIDLLLPGRRLVLFGVSAGALVALHMSERLPMTVLLDPFLDVGQCWALRELVTRVAPPDSPAGRWAEEVFGPGLRGDYRYLLSHLGNRTIVMVGETPLEPPRRLANLPSLASSAERELWRQAPGAELIVCPGAGHNIPDDSRPTMLAVLRRALADA